MSPILRLIIAAALTLSVRSGSLQAQNTGVPKSLSLPDGRTSLTLDLTDQDYQLILYSALRDESDTTRTYNFTVAGSFATKPVVDLISKSVQETHDHHSLLRHEEAELATRFRETGVPPATKRAIPFQVGSTRTFVFESFGNVSTLNVTATLAASNSRAEAWIDNNTSAITTAEAQAQIDQFTNSTYPIVTGVFGEPSDVDSDGKVLFLYTELVDQVGDVAGFYRSKSLFSTQDGGDGNVADMMYIGLDHSDTFFESLLAHEFQHLINYNQHVRVRNGPSETAPINEAMSHIAEDLVNQHTQGGNPSNIRTYTSNPSIYSILAESAHDSGVRGTAYTFARSMMESFGDDIPTQLVQTSLSGIANVEDVSGQTFEQVYETYLARMFLAGSGLNSSYEFTYPFFTDPTTGGRSLPVPDERAINPDVLTATGSVKAYAAASIRLMGTGVSSFDITTDISGEFRGILIPLPRGFQHNVALKPDYFAGYTFDAPITGNYTTGEATRFTGSTTLTENNRILFRFDPVVAGLDTVEFSADIVNGQFALSVLFSHDRAGDYEMSIFSGLQGESLPFVGRVPTVHVAPGSGTVDLPSDFFSGIQLDNTVSTEVSAGDAVRLSGTISNASISKVSFEFTHLVTGEQVATFMETGSGSFETVFVFTPEQTGSYILKVYAGQAGNSLPLLGEFRGFTVTEGSGEILIPVDFFKGLTLQTGMPTDIASGRAINLSGTVTDSDIEVLIFRFTSDQGDEIQYQIEADQGSFQKGAIFRPSQAGTYKLDVFGGPSGGSLPHQGDFSPIVVTASDGPHFLPIDAFSGMTLDEPLLTELFSSGSLRLSGTLANTTVTQIAVRLDSVDGSVRQAEFGDVSSGQFDVTVPTSGMAIGDYTIVVFTGQAGQSLSSLDSVGPVSVVSSQPRASLATSLVAFGSIDVEDTDQQSLTIQNVGSQTLTVAASVSGSAFSTPTSAVTVAAGSSSSITIVFTPSTDGGSTGTLTLSTNDPTRPTIALDLVGTGAATAPPPVPVLTLSATTLSFPSTEIGTSATLTVSLQNTGNADLSLSALSVDGPFSATADATIAPAEGTITIEVVFNPVAAGDFTGTLSVTTNAGDDPTQITLAASATSSPPPPADATLLGDIDGNKTVDFSDFLSFAGAFGTSSGDAGYLALADLDDSGSVDFSDFLTFASLFGKSV